MKLCEKPSMGRIHFFIARYTRFILIATVLVFIGVTIYAFESVTNGSGTTQSTIGGVK